MVLAIAAPALAQVGPEEVWCVSDVFPQVTSVAMSSDGSMVAIAGMTGYGDDAGISVRNANDGSELRLIPVPGLPRCIAWRTGTTQIACAYMTIANPSSFPVQVYDAADGSAVVTMTGFVQNPTALAYSPDGATLATMESRGGSNGWNAWHAVRIFDSTSGTEVSGLAVGTVGSPTSLAYSPDGTQIATGIGVAAPGGSNAVLVWEVATGQIIQTIEVGDGVRTVDSVQYSPDGTKLAATNGNGRLRVWNTSDWSVARTFEASAIIGSQRGHVVAFSPDSDLIAWGVGPNPLATLFVRVSTGQTVASYTEGALSGLEFMPDGRNWIRSSDHWGYGACLNVAP